MLNKYFTICDFNYLNLGITLGNSLLKSNTTNSFTIVLCDPYHFISEDLLNTINLSLIKSSGMSVVLDRDILLKDVIISFDKDYNIIEYCTAIKPYCFEFFLNSNELIVFLDPDIYVYKNINHFFNYKLANIYLTPHTVHRTYEPDKIDSLREYRFLQVGVFNLGFLGLRRSQNAILFINWWKAHLVKHCKIDYSKGLFVDQKWMDLVPCLFENIEILKHEGLNIAYWNLENRDINDIFFIHYSSFENLYKYDNMKKYLIHYKDEISSIEHNIRNNFRELYMKNLDLKKDFKRQLKMESEIKFYSNYVNRISIKVLKMCFLCIYKIFK
jgi:hypothetical protein